ncbi:uncharacterized protein zgc:194930 [Anguilla anguilla]|uniref:Uncharacterized protein n=1 Tax=Anguilla anguilla TaxID=7936 RepID=A0A9D3MAP4_ANGAN|nr:uncharacterized protein zgc:194930 [Anguilla anguilla]XP_035281548.1 uncharacterized protein zgc:194930 [Anguilla anguilla]XP_035281550.1 uncharacterized protein zgc:194930 [Anguilla anguilla]KAG5845524.1 hypothetical protein ANANG_G00140060 [Anguilla anguilla]
MGCRCCRMLKSYIYDPSVPVEVHGRRHDSSSSSSLYQSKPLETDNIHKVQGFHNLGYSHKYGDNLKNGSSRLEIDNNQINRLHAPPGDGAQDRPSKLESGNSALYILHPQESTLKCVSPCQPRPLPGHLALQTSAPCGPVEKLEGRLMDGTSLENGGPFPGARGEDDAESVLSGRSEDVNTSTTSLSSVDAKDRVGRGETSTAPEVSATESGSSSEGEDEEGDSGSVTDSEVAEALAALEAATADEDADED